MVYKTSQTPYQIYFVIDATASMAVDIKKARKSIINMANNEQLKKRIKVLFYTDHDVHNTSKLIRAIPGKYLPFSDDLSYLV